LQQLAPGRKTKLIGDVDGDKGLPFPAAIAVLGKTGAEKLLVAGKDPSMVKKDTRRQAIQKHKNSFEIVAREWHDNQTEKWTPPT